MLPPTVDGYINQLVRQVRGVKEIDRSSVSRYTRYNPGEIEEGIRASALNGKASTTWSVSRIVTQYDTGQSVGFLFWKRRRRYRRNVSNTDVELYADATKSFSLNYGADQQLREVVVNFARQNKGEVVEDLPHKIGIKWSESFAIRKPNSNFVSDISTLVGALANDIFYREATEVDRGKFQGETLQQPIPIPPTPKPTFIPTPSPTPPVTTVSLHAPLPVPPSYAQKSRPLASGEPFLVFRIWDPKAWALREIHGDWKEIPEAALRRNGYTRRITGASSSRITVEIIPLLERNDES